MSLRSLRFAVEQPGAPLLTPSWATPRGQRAGVDLVYESCFSGARFDLHASRRADIIVNHTRSGQPCRIPTGVWWKLWKWAGIRKQNREEST